MSAAPPADGSKGRRPLVAGNWKMNTLVEEGVALARTIATQSAGITDVEIAVLPPFTHLWAVREALQDSAVLLGAQDVFWEDSGAFTGEISSLMLRGWCDLVLTGHSERRHILGETDSEVGRKAARAQQHGLRVIIAVGETESERDSGATFAVVDRQLATALQPVQHPDGDRIVIAYEPVWAIGTGRTATPEQAEQVCAHIKEVVRELTHITDVGVLYGGSVTASNAASLFAQPHIDGGLIGGASLEAGEFLAIVQAARSA